MARTLTATFVADPARLNKGLNQVNKQLGDAGKAGGQNFAKGVDSGTAGIGSKLKTAIPWAAVAAGGAAAFAWLTGTAKDAEAAAVANGKLEKVLRNMGKAGAADALDAQATALSKIIGVEDDAIKGTQTLLATFSNVAASAGETGGAFDRATKAAHDMAAAGFGDASGNAKQLGKALQDPLKGITALSRSGVTFTAQQKEQIKQFVKTGDVAKAQALILSEVEKQVGGAGAAAATPAQKAAVAWGEFREEVGGYVLPIIQRLQTFVADLLPVVQDLVGRIGQLGEWVQRNQRLLTDLAVVFGVVTAAVVAYTVAQQVMAAGGIVQFILGVIKSTRLWAVAQGLLNIVMSLNPIGIVILAITALVAAIVIAYRNSETFRKIVSAAWNGIKTAALTVWNFLKGVFTGLVQFHTVTIPAAARLFRDRVVAAWDTLKNGLRSAWLWIKSKTIDPFVLGFTLIRDKAVELRDRVVDTFDGLKRGIADKFGGMVDAVKQPFRTVFGWVNDNVIAKFNALPFAPSIPLLPTQFSHGTRRVVPGYAPGVDKVHALLSPGEGVLVPEVERKFPGIVDLLNRMGLRSRAGLSGFAHGGIAGTGGQHGGMGGIGDWLGRKIKTVTDIMGDPGGAIMTMLQRGAGALGSTYFGRWMFAVLEAARTKITDWLKGKGAGAPPAAASVSGPPGALTGSWGSPIPGRPRWNNDFPNYGSGRYHGGRDIGVGYGTPIYAIQAGKVGVSRDMAGSYGRHIRLLHAGGFQSLYAHLASRAVTAGAAVTKGQLIGRADSTGNSTGNHLHLAMWRNHNLGAYGGALDPRRFVMDSGGWLPPGRSIVDNNTGQPERVIAPDQPATIIEIQFHDERLINLIDVRVKDDRTRQAKVEARKRVIPL